MEQILKLGSLKDFINLRDQKFKRQSKEFDLIAPPEIVLDSLNDNFVENSPQNNVNSFANTLQSPISN